MITVPLTTNKELNTRKYPAHNVRKWRPLPLPHFRDDRRSRMIAWVPAHLCLRRRVAGRGGLQAIRC